MTQTFKDFLIEEEEIQYGVFPKGGSVGSRNDKPWKVFADKEDAKAYAKRMRKQLSKGERGYYGMGYVTRPLKGQALKDALEALNEGVKAKWKPMRIGSVHGNELVVQGKNGWTTAGFYRKEEKPTTGKVKVFNAVKNKDVDVDLGKYNFISEASRMSPNLPSPDEIENFVREVYYIYDEDNDHSLTIEEHVPNVGKVKIKIEFDHNKLDVHVLDYDMFEDEYDAHKVENEIFKEITNGA